MIEASFSSKRRRLFSRKSSTCHYSEKYISFWQNDVLWRVPCMHAAPRFSRRYMSVEKLFFWGFRQWFFSFWSSRNNQLFSDDDFVAQERIIGTVHLTNTTFLETWTKATPTGFFSVFFSRVPSEHCCCNVSLRKLEWSCIFASLLSPCADEPH